MVTDETLSVARQAEDHITSLCCPKGGLKGAIVLLVGTKAVEDAAVLSHIMLLVSEAQEKRASIEATVDRLTTVFVFLFVSTSAVVLNT